MSENAGNNTPSYISNFRNKDFTKETKESIRDYPFRNADLRGANFTGCQHLYGLDFSGAKIHGAIFENTNLVGASFENAENSEADEVSISKEEYSVNFRGAKICGANFRSANLNKADFSGAKTDYPAWWKFFIKVLMIFLSIVSSLVLFHSIDIGQVFLIPNGDQNALSSVVSEITKVVADENLQSSDWPPEIPIDAQEVEKEFLIIIDDVLLLSTQIRKECVPQEDPSFDWRNFRNFLMKNGSVCETAERFIDLAKPQEYNDLAVVAFAIITAAGILIIISLSINVNLFGIAIILISISIVLAAITHFSVSISIFYGLLALLGTVSGLLAQSVSIAFGLASEIPKGEYRITNNLRWFSCVVAMSMLSFITIPIYELYRIWIPLIVSIFLLALGAYIGEKTINRRHKILFHKEGETASLEFEKYFIIEIFVVQLLRIGPVTNFWNAQFEGVKFENVRLKKYSTLVGGRNYDGNTLKAILWGEDIDAQKTYEKMLRRSNILENSLWYGNPILNVWKNRMQELWILGNINNEGIMNFGEIVDSHINQLSSSPLQKEIDFNIDQNLKNLLDAVKTAESMSNKEKYKVMRNIEEIVNELR